MHEAVLPGVETIVVSFGVIGGGGQSCGDEGSDGGIFLLGPMARISRVFGGRTAVVTRGVIREEILEELGRFDVGEFYGRDAGRDGLETVGSRVDEVRRGILDGGEPPCGPLAQLWGGVCRGKVQGGTDVPSNL